MATTQKKTGSGGKRQASAKKTASSGSRSNTGSRKKSTSGNGKKTQRPIRREVGAVICLVLGIFSALGYFKVEAVFIDLFCGALKGLCGYGFYLWPIMLLITAYILAFHRGRPVRLRVWCALLFPVVLGAILHLALAPAAYELGPGLAAALWKDGLALKAGGLVSGALAVCFETLFSAVGSAIVFTIVAVLMLFGTFNRSILDLMEAIRSRPHPQYEAEEEPEPSPRERQAALRQAEQDEKAQPKRSKTVYDIPVEDGPLVGRNTGRPEPEEVLETGEKKSFFNRNSRVKRPDEVLLDSNGSAAGKTPAAAPAPGPAPEPTPASAPQKTAAPAAEAKPKDPEPAPVAPPITREPAVQKVKPEEAAAAAAEVGRDIESAMSAGSTRYQYPPLSLLKEGDDVVGSEALGELQRNQQRLADTIHSFGIDANIINVVRGPAVTRYELELDQGVRLNRLTNLSDDIALALGASGVRIAPIPDKSSVVGIEVPNKLVAPVSIHSVIGSKKFCEHPSKVAFAVGKDIAGNCIVGNIAKMPHLLIAGTTGSGKSVCTNSLIISLLYKATPDEVRLIMVDPKMVELSIYNGIPHLLIPVVTDPKKAAGALQWAVTEMMKRYRAFSEIGVRDLVSYNETAAHTEGMEKMPQVVVVIDELADLMMVAAKEVEESICRIAQMGRASGIHLIIATQRPSADVITGLMKANIPSRIALTTASALESRIILDAMGAEKLVGHGDMLYAPVGEGKLRVQGCYISDHEVASVVEFVKRSGQAVYSEEILHEIDQHVAEKEKGGKGSAPGAASEEGGDYDELLPNAIEVVVETGMASVSMLQRRLKLGYSRAARLVDQMEEKGIVGPFEGSKPRQVLITKEQWQEMQFRNDMTPSASVGGQPGFEPEEMGADDMGAADCDEDEAPF